MKDSCTDSGLKTGFIWGRSTLESGNEADATKTPLSPNRKTKLTVNGDKGAQRDTQWSVGR